VLASLRHRGRPSSSVFALASPARLVFPVGDYRGVKHRATPRSEGHANALGAIWSLESFPAQRGGVRGSGWQSDSPGQSWPGLLRAACPSPGRAFYKATSVCHGQVHFQPGEASGGGGSSAVGVSIWRPGMAWAPDAGTVSRSAFQRLELDCVLLRPGACAPRNRSRS
jgi:hypothetical protein